MTIMTAIERIMAETRRTDSVTVVAASKSRSAEEINALPGVSIVNAGENRVQELLEKYNAVKGVTWHFIGALQTNKVKYIIDKVDLIHSVDRVSLADEINRRAAAVNKVQNVLVEVNAGGEDNKSGVLFSEAEGLCAYVAGLQNVRLTGLMGVFPVNAPDSLYKRLSGLYNRTKPVYGLSVLSMGMTNDYERAVRFGSNLIRIGSGLFGPRTYG